MSFFKRISQTQKEDISPFAAASELVEKARRAQYREDYEEALQLLDEASSLIDHSHENRSEFDIAFGRADVLMAMGRFEEAESSLQELRKICEKREMKAPLAYTLCSLGQLAQKQNLFEKAQNYYESARDIGQTLRTTGAGGRASAHLADLHLRDGNASYAVYLLEDALPKLDKSGDRELIAYFQGRLGLAYMQLGNHEKGLRALLAGRDMARRLEHRPQLRSLEILLGKSFAEAGDFRRSREHDLAALALNPEASERAMLLCRLSISSRKLQDLSSARQEAEAALEIANAEGDKALLAKAQACLGLALQEEGLPYLHAAADAYEDLRPDSTYIDVLRRLGTVADLKKAIALAADMPLAAAHAQSDLAMLYQEEKHLKDALAAWQEALKLYQAVNQISHQARVQCEIASLYERMGDGRMALREYGHALEYLAHFNDTETRGLILANVAAAYSEYGEIEAAQDFFKESIEIIQKQANPAAEALRCGNFGRLLALTGHAREALPLIQQAYSTSETLGLKLQAAVMKGNEGLALAMLGEYESAENAFTQALSNLTEEQSWQAIILIYWAEMLLEQGKSSEHYQKALELAKSENLISVIVQANIGLANQALLEQRFDDAQEHLSEIDAIAKRLFYKRPLALLYQSWSRLYAAQDKQEEAQSAWEEARKLRTLMRMPSLSPDWL